MKKVFIIILMLISMQAFTQTDGITYQAVIIGPDRQELPGIDAENNILPNATVAIRFTIIDANNSMEYQEVQTTNTDQYGRINLLIGAADHDAFTKINWDGTNKDLKVEIDFTGGTDYVDMSREQLTFLPFAFHRNIKATGTLTVDDKTYLNSELTVQGPTNLNSTLDVNNNNETNLTGALNVEGKTALKDTLTVEELATFNGEVIFNDKTSFKAPAEFVEITVNGISNLNGQVTINTNLDSEEANDDIIEADGKSFNKYPLKIEGSSHGIAIKVNGSRGNKNNFISFWDDGPDKDGNKPAMWGRIEGEKLIDSNGNGELDGDEYEFMNDNDFEFDIKGLNYDMADAILDLIFATNDLGMAHAELAASLSSSTGCAGLGACITAPIPSFIANAYVQLVMMYLQEASAIVYTIKAPLNKKQYLEKRENNQGVTYQSGAGDYAEYLLRENSNETIRFGDIVGVKGGKISKNTSGSERMMVISRKPIVLGNMPQPNKEKDYEKVAFMGQVPVKVFGKVNIGDYILPSGKNDGIGIAITPSNITIENIKKIVGIAWSTSDNVFGFNMVTVAVGLNTNDNNPILEKLETEVKEQAIVINTLKEQLVILMSRMDALEQGKTNLINEAAFHDNIPKKGEVNGRKYEIEDTPQGEIIYWETKIEDFENGLALAEKTMLDAGVDLENNEFWQQIKTNPDFKIQLFNKIKKNVEKQFNYQKAISLEKQ